MSKLIDELTPEQEALIPKYLAEYKAIGTSTEPTDRAKAEAAVLASYAYLKMDKPEIIWAEDPIAGAKLAQEYSSEPMPDPASYASYGSFEAYWVSTYAYIAEVLPVEKDELIDIVKDIVKNCGVYWTFEGLVILTPKPIKIKFNDKEELHCEDGYAVEYASGYGWYALNGNRYGSLAELTMAARYEKV